MGQGSIPPGEGERRAQRGYVAQYAAAAAAIYAALQRDDLQWVGLADRGAGIADDVVLGLHDRVIGHQFKTSRYPKPFRLSTLLLGADGLLLPLVDAWQRLRSAFPGQKVEVHLVTNDYPSTTDELVPGADGHTAALGEELQLNINRPLAGWQATRWWPFIQRMLVNSGLNENDFEHFLAALRVVSGPAADFVLAHYLSPEGARQAAQIATALPRLVADQRNRDRWTRAEFLDELGWKDSLALRRGHQFPVGAYVQRNEVTERELRGSLAAVSSGYVALIGPPGSGKSTLLQIALVPNPSQFLVRYLAFIPAEAQGVGRGEAEDFFDDVNTQLRRTGLSAVSFQEVTLQEKRHQFELLLAAASTRFQKEGVRTAIVVDGLDHVPREEKPLRSLLAELPSPAAIPEGVVIVLGTQRLDLPDLRPAIGEQVSLVGRCVVMAPLSQQAVSRIAESAGLSPEISRRRLNELSLGHPLITRYLVGALRGADQTKIDTILGGNLSFNGDVEAVYTSAWRDIARDAEARRVLEYIARAEGPIPPEMLAAATSERAVERALQSTRHLLELGRGGWRMFHNSFRLFVLDRPHLRFDVPDPSYGPEMYKRLAELARSHSGSSPQRWLELRYLARAEAHEQVLALARPERFRRQLAEGRSVSDLRTDIRLVFGAVRRAGDATGLFRVMLIQDELGRRASALRDAPAIAQAFVALGDLDAAQSYAEGHEAAAYEVIDALVNAGEIDRARALFDQVEPVTGTSAHQDLSISASEFDDWSHRVYLFREPDQIHEAIDAISAKDSLWPNMDPKSIAARLRSAVARAAISYRPSSDPDELARQMCLGPDEIPFLLAEAVFGAVAAETEPLANDLLVRTLSDPAFGTLPNAWRRDFALIACRRGRDDLARGVFRELTPPEMASLDGSTSEKKPEQVARAVVQHSQLATMLGEPIVQVTPSKRPALRPVQLHASLAGVLLAKARTGAVGSGEVERATRAFLLYVEQVRPSDNSEYYAMTQIAVALPTIASALLEAASACGHEEFDRVLEEFDRGFANPTLRKFAGPDLARKIHVDAYHLSGDARRAVERLSALLPLVLEQTPAAQIEQLAHFAAAFANVGDETRARELLQRLHEETLGYALAPKKDPQYALWLAILQRANAEDPGGRAERVAFITRQIAGMAKTEGDASARRISSAVLTEATLVDAATGLCAARTLTDLGLLTWDGMLNALLLGVVRRRPEIATVCTTVWCSLALPFYSEPYYRSSALGEFVTASLEVVEQHQLDSVIETVRAAIAAESAPEGRLDLFQRLIEGANRRGCGKVRLTQELDRWRSEALPGRPAYTPERYDDVDTLSALEERFRAEGDETHWERPRAFARLIASAEFPDAVRVFEETSEIQRDPRSRFALVDKAVEHGDVALARRLVEEFPNLVGDRAQWSSWMGAGKVGYFRNRIKLNGAAVIAEAFADLVTELAAGREFLQDLLLAVEDFMPIISAQPDWAAMWGAVSEQIAQTREYSIGSLFALDREVASDEELLSALFQWAYSLNLSEVERHCRVAALDLAAMSNEGRAVFERLIRKLLDGAGDQPVEALLLLSWASQFAAGTFASTVAGLVNHSDYAVGVLAGRLARRWGISAATSRSELPAFYRITLVGDDGTEFERPASMDPASGAMRVEDAMGWTFALGSMIRPLARGDITVGQIRHRCAMLISGWGGLPAFGHGESNHLRAELGRLQMRLNYARPHMVAAVRAVRYVAGELRNAGLLGKSDETPLLQLLGCPPVGVPVPVPEERPAFVARPSAPRVGSREEEADWLQAADEDLRRPSLNCDFLLAGFTRYVRRDIRRQFVVERLEIPSAAPIEGANLDDWMYSLPSAVWLDEVVARLSDEPSPVLVRRLELRSGPNIPSHFLVLCPLWLRRLRWHAHSNNWLVYADSNGSVVARVAWWRDGGPGDVQDDVFWGEGVVVVVTPQGRKQLEAVAGKLPHAAVARRLVGDQPQDQDEKRQERLVRSPLR
jgi:hypothetical protein